MLLILHYLHKLKDCKMQNISSQRNTYLPTTVEIITYLHMCILRLFPQEPMKEITFYHLF